VVNDEENGIRGHVEIDYLIRLDRQLLNRPFDHGLEASWVDTLFMLSLWILGNDREINPITFKLVFKVRVLEYVEDGVKLSDAH
jgi:hypothetical protein